MDPSLYKKKLAESNLYFILRFKTITIQTQSIIYIFLKSSVHFNLQDFYPSYIGE